MASTASEARKKLARIRAFQEMWKKGEVERKAYETALDNGPDAFSAHISIMDGEGGPIPLTVLNFYTRLRNRVEAHCFDESPENTYPREAAGDESLADGIGRLVSRITEESRLPFQCRDGITNLMTAGGFGIVYGMPNMPTAEEVDERAKGTPGIVADAAKGIVNPVVGQDHDTAATVATEQALDPVNVLVNPPEVMASLLGAAAAHMEADEDEETGGVFWKDKELPIFTDRVEIGSHLAYDTSRGDHLLGTWLAYAIDMKLEEAQNHPAFKKSVRKRLVGSIPAPVTGINTPQVPGVTWEGMGEEEKVAENGVVKIWCYFDARSKKRHYIPETLKDGDIEFLEKDDKNPYLDDNGKQLLPWCWPVEVFIYRRSAKMGPYRALPIPYMRDGWDQQIESIKFDTMLGESTKAALTDKYMVDAQVDDETKAAITNSYVHVCVTKPAGLERGKDAMEAIQFKPPLQEAFAERRNCQDRFCIAVNFPISQFTSQPVADTLGQDEIALSSGNEQTADVVRMLECFYARVCQGILYIIAAKLPSEVAAEYMGPGYEEQWDGWRQTSLRGDLLRTKFAPTTREQNPVRAKQLIDVYTVGSAARHPILPQFPLFAPSGLVSVMNEATKCLGVGALPQFVPTQEDIDRVNEMQAQQPQNSQNAEGGGNGGPPGNGPRSPEQAQKRPNIQGNGRQDRGRAPPQREQINSGARRI